MSILHFWNGSGVRLSVAGVLAAVLASAVPAWAFPDEFVDRVNKPLTEVRAEVRGETALLPLLAKLQAPPAGVTSVEDAVMLSPGGGAWDEAKAWAEGPTQKAVLDLLGTAYRVEDPRKLPVFAQPYGAEGISAELLKAGMYTDLGEAGMLGAARFLYLQGMGNLEILVHVEATRRTDAGEGASALTLLADFAALARSIADRSFFREVHWGTRAMTGAVERMRDVAYVDFRSKKGLGSEALTGLPALIQRLDADKGFLELARLRLPVGDRVAGEQAIAKVYIPRGGVNESFAAVMSSFGASERPLRLFAESARWQGAAGNQKSWFDVREQLPKVYEDWSARWLLDPLDSRLTDPFYVTKIERESMAVLDQTLPPMEQLFAARQIIRVEVAGTRASLGVLGFSYANKVFPKSLAAVRPKWVRQLDADPFNPNQTKNLVLPLEFFVPIRDQMRSERDEPRPHQVSIQGPPEFTVDLGDDQFIVYSVGADGVKNLASKVANVVEEVEDADYLIWPPIMALRREESADGVK